MEKENKTEEMDYAWPSLTDIAKEIGSAIVFFGVMFGVCSLLPLYIYTASREKYVVTDKGADKIVVKRLDGTDTISRVMQFEDAAKGMEYYKYIKPGDTVDLRGVGYDEYFVFKNHKLNMFSNITAINGKKLKSIKYQERHKSLQEKIAERDSLIRQIRQANQKVR